VPPLDAGGHADTSSGRWRVTGDLDTADLLNEVSRQVSKYLWVLEAHLRDGSSVPVQPTGQGPP
jgi:NAD(P)H-dependent flavin oxidoreductase YrpB (nitropropane dioxygenase family)